MKKILIIVPDGGMLFEAAGIADILMQANRLHGAQHAAPRYRITLATTQPHQVIHGQSGLNLLADNRLTVLDPFEPRDTIMITGRGTHADEGDAVASWVRMAAPHTRRVTSICGGAMLLAQAGLLDAALMMSEATLPGEQCWRRLREVSDDQPLPYFSTILVNKQWEEA